MNPVLQAAMQLLSMFLAFGIVAWIMLLGISVLFRKPGAFLKAHTRVGKWLWRKFRPLLRRYRSQIAFLLIGFLLGAWAMQPY